MGDFFRASQNPIADIDRMSYEGQPKHMRMYESGYESYFDALPKLEPNDPELQAKLEITRTVMDDLASKLVTDPKTQELQPGPNKFNRTILAVEEQDTSDGHTREGSEIVLARWGDGFSSPVHGHAPGLLYERLIFGKMRVNTYRVTDNEKRIARPIETKIYKDFEEIVSSYAKPSAYPRSALVHNFTSIGNSASLHFVPEHTRDGRDNRFTVEYFDREYPVDPEAFVQLDAQQGIEQFKIGDVALVRSGNVPDYGDHWIVITGKPVLKEHGLRPQDVAIQAPYAAAVLDKFEPINGLKLLRLDDDQLRESFYKFHDIGVNGEKVTFPVP